MTKKDELNKLFIVTVNWNQPLVTLKCIKSIRNTQIEGSNIVIVDNGSEDNSVELFYDTFHDIHVLENKENLGFSGGFNTGIKYALSKGAEYVFMVNNDTVFPSDMINTFFSAAKETKADISSPLILYGDQPDKIWSAGGYYCKLLSAPLDAHRRNKLLPDKPIRREFLTGCALLIHKKVFETIGYFDESFFLYYEDLDFLKRANDMGFKIWLIPQAKLLHYECTSSQGLYSEKVVYWMAFSSQLYLKKHAKAWQWFFILPWRFLHSIKRVFQFVSEKKYNLIRPYFLGIFSIEKEKNQTLFKS
jgi:hypothetical protein